MQTIGEAVAWFEGEGCITTFHTNKCVSISLDAVSCDKDTLLAFKSILNIGKIRPEYAAGIKIMRIHGEVYHVNVKAAYRWSVRKTEDVAIVLKKMFPYFISVHRKLQVSTVLELAIESRKKALELANNNYTRSNIQRVLPTLIQLRNDLYR